MKVSRIDSGGVICYEEDKCFWQPKQTVKVTIVEYKRFACFEVVAYDSVSDIETPRVYLDCNLIGVLIDQSEFYRRLSAKREHLLHSNQQYDVDVASPPIIHAMEIEYIVARMKIPCNGAFQIEFVPLDCDNTDDKKSSLFDIVVPKPQRLISLVIPRPRKISPLDCGKLTSTAHEHQSSALKARRPHSSIGHHLAPLVIETSTSKLPEVDPLYLKVPLTGNLPLRKSVLIRSIDDSHIVENTTPITSPKGCGNNVILSPLPKDIMKAVSTFGGEERRIAGMEDIFSPDCVDERRRRVDRKKSIKALLSGKDITSPRFPELVSKGFGEIRKVSSCDAADRKQDTHLLPGIQIHIPQVLSLSKSKSKSNTVEPEGRDYFDFEDGVDDSPSPYGYDDDNDDDDDEDSQIGISDDEFESTGVSPRPKDVDSFGQSPCRISQSMEHSGHISGLKVIGKLTTSHQITTSITNTYNNIGAGHYLKTPVVAFASKDHTTNVSMNHGCAALSITPPSSTMHTTTKSTHPGKALGFVYKVVDAFSVVSPIHESEPVFDGISVNDVIHTRCEVKKGMSSVIKNSKIELPTPIKTESTTLYIQNGMQKRSPASTQSPSSDDLSVRHQQQPQHTHPLHPSYTRDVFTSTIPSGKFSPTCNKNKNSDEGDRKVTKTSPNGINELHTSSPAVKMNNLMSEEFTVEKDIHMFSTNTYRHKRSPLVNRESKYQG